MTENIFAVGKPQEILDVLNNKDQRVALQANLLATYPDAAIVAIKLNVPGPIKNNSRLEKLFDEGLTAFKALLTKSGVSDPWEVVNWERDTGNETFMVFREPAEKIKHLAVDFEDHHALGRLFDVDVLDAALGSRPLSRSDFGLESRRCLICGRPAKECARSRRHSVAELQAKINQMYWDYFD